MTEATQSRFQPVLYPFINNWLYYTSLLLEARTPDGLLPEPQFPQRSSVGVTIVNTGTGTTTAFLGNGPRGGCGWVCAGVSAHRFTRRRY
jgi:hypothetical protein